MHERSGTLVPSSSEGNDDGRSPGASADGGELASAEAGREDVRSLSRLPGQLIMPRRWRTPLSHDLAPTRRSPAVFTAASTALDGVPALVEGLLPWGVALIVISAVLGGLAQGTVGFGAAFATVPALALAAPELLPGAMLVAALPLTTVMAVLERSGIDRPSTRRLLIARVPGIAIGTGIVVVADVRWLTLLVGAVLLAAVAAASFGWHLSVTPGREWGAGVISGITGAATALGGPPLAILYRGRDPAVTRPTLAVVWAGGIAMTLGSLALVGDLTTVQVVLGAGLSMAVLGGLVLGRQVVAKVTEGAIRSAVLWWAAFGGSAAVLRAITA